MAKHELHGQKLTPFEQGYMAFGKGTPVGQNPYEESAPFSRSAWANGWDKAKREAGRKV